MMRGSYRQCSECGKRALSIATRCPGCGRELTTPAVSASGPAPKLGRLRSPRVLAGILVAAAVLTTARLGRTSRPPEAQSSSIAAHTVAPSTEVAYTAAWPTESEAEVLVAKTWTSVRKSRSKSADLEAVLLPGDTVVADSLARGWYRVALEGEILGYVHRSTLAAPQLGVPRSEP